jgi:hypothetical protein
MFGTPTRLRLSEEPRVPPLAEWITRPADLACGRGADSVLFPHQYLAVANIGPEAALSGRDAAKGEECLPALELPFGTWGWLDGSG